MPPKEYRTSLHGVPAGVERTTWNQSDGGVENIVARRNYGVSGVVEEVLPETAVETDQHSEAQW